MLQNKLIGLHNHTIYSDGKNTPEEMAEEALRLGFQTFGFSDHSFTSFDTDYCMAYERYEAYKSEILTLKEKYEGKLQILCGIEQDFYSAYPAEGFDYIIGSAHYVKVPEEFIPIDWGEEEGSRIILNAADKYFNGDVYSLIDAYYETISSVVEQTNADIIGHFDVIAKSNEQLPFFDPEHPRYVAAWKKAADSLLEKGKIFEINVSPLLNGTLKNPHPATDIQEYLKACGAKFLYTGDCHSIQRLRDFAGYLKEEKGI